MSDDIYPGGPVMIKIDGSKIRRIREQKGLTQLYVATAVEVTTDTVSRWENKRYPSIKKENGIKLAKALEVELEDILDTTPETPEDAPSTKISEAVEATTAKDVPPVTRLKMFASLRTRLLLSMMFIPLLGILLYVLYIQTKDVDPEIIAHRTIPKHFIAGHPLPVFISISAVSDTPISFILRETLPPGTQMLSAHPDTAIKPKKNGSIQWLGTINNTALFTYTVSTENTFSGTIVFDGLLKISSSSNLELAISGDNSSSSGMHHWADQDRDNRISDEEILNIYDMTTTSHHASIDMDLLEEIWLGEGYAWLPEKQQFSIHE